MWVNARRGNELWEEVGHMDTSGNRACQLASRGILKDFTDDVLTISAGSLFQNGTPRMLKAYWRQRVQHICWNIEICMYLWLWDVSLDPGVSPVTYNCTFDYLKARRHSIGLYRYFWEQRSPPPNNRGLWNIRKALYVIIPSWYKQKNKGKFKMPFPADRALNDDNKVKIGLYPLKKINKIPSPHTSRIVIALI